jgi:hypothetical protein
MRTLLKPAILAVVVVGTLSASREARAQGGNFGLGIIIGSPTGLSAKYYLSEGKGHAIDAALGLATLGNHGIHVHVDYLWHPLVLAREESFDLAMYVGLGGRLLDHDRGRDFDDHFHVGARAPLGLVFDFLRGGVPIDVFVEVALVLDFILDDDNGRGDEDSIDLDLNAGIGARYYF